MHCEGRSGLDDEVLGRLPFAVLRVVSSRNDLGAVKFGGVERGTGGVGRWSLAVIEGDREWCTRIDLSNRVKRGTHVDAAKCQCLPKNVDDGDPATPRAGP